MTTQSPFITLVSIDFKYLSNPNALSRYVDIHPEYRAPKYGINFKSVFSSAVGGGIEILWKI